MQMLRNFVLIASSFSCESDALTSRQPSSKYTANEGLSSASGCAAQFFSSSKDAKDVGLYFASTVLESYAAAFYLREQRKIVLLI